MLGFMISDRSVRRDSFIRLSYLLLLCGCFVAVMGTLLAMDPSVRKSRKPRVAVKAGPAYGKRVSLRSLDLSRAPSDEELKLAGQLGGALSPEPQMEESALKTLATAARTKRREADNLLFGQAMQKWNEHHYQEAIVLFKQHRKDFPQSQWTGEVELHSGCEAQFNGRWNEAAFAFDWILNHAPKGSDIYQKARLRRSVLHLEQGEVNKALSSFSEMLKTEKDWNRRTYAQSWIRQLSLMRKNMQAVRTCGSESIAYVLKNQGKKQQAEKALTSLAKSEDGFTVGQLTDFAQKMGLKAQAVSSKPLDLAALPKPFIAHYRDLHYVVIREMLGNGKIRVYDPRLKHDTLLTLDQFNQQWSGLAVIFGKRPNGVNLATTAQLKETGGCCGVARPLDDLGKPDDPPCGCGLPAWSVNMVNMNLYVNDIPMWYAPTRGPSISIELSYNSQISGMVLTPFGEKWSFNYASYLTEDPGTTVTVVMPDGRSDRYTLNSVSGTYDPPVKSYNKLTKVDDYTFTLETPDGILYRYGVPAAMSAEGLPHSATLGTSSLLLSITDRFGQSVVITHNSNGAIETIADAFGRETVFFYNENGYVSRIDDPFGRSCTFTYDATGNLVGQSDMAGISYSYTYDDTRYLTSITKPSGTTLFYIEPADGIRNGPYNAGDPYPPSGTAMWDDYRITVTHPDNNKEEFHYNGYHGYGWHRDKLQYTSTLPAMNAPKTRYNYYNYLNTGTNKFGVISSISTAGGSASVITSFNSKLKPLQTVNQVGRANSYAYNDQGQVTASTNTLGYAVLYTYAPNGLDVTSVTNQLGKLVSLTTYTDKRQVATVTDAMTNTTAYGYNSYGQLTAVTNAFGKPEQRVTLNEYNPGTGQLEKIKVVAGGVTNTVATYTYDPIGRVSSATDANNYTLRYAYDGLNRRIRTTYPDGTSDRSFYSCCHIEKTIDRSGRTTSYMYDKAGKLIYTRDPAGRIIQYERDLAGNLKKLIDGNGNVTKFDYDADYHVTRKTYADGKYDTYGYDVSGNMTNLVSGISASGSGGLATTYGYDDLNRLSDITYSGAITPSVHFDYDEASRRKQMIEKLGASTNSTVYTYDDVNRLKELDGPLANDKIVYSYDNLGRLMGRTINGSSNSVAIHYDALGRVSTLSNPLGTFTYSYASATSARLTGVDYPNGQHTTYTYELGGDQRLNQIQNLTTGNTPLSRFDYAYNTAGQITEWTQQVDTSTPLRYDLTYDQADALQRANLVNTSTSATVKTFSYTYDRGDNRLGEQIDNVPRGASYNKLNQLTARTAGGAGPLQVAGTATNASVVTLNGKRIGIDAQGNFSTTLDVVSDTVTLTLSATNATNTTVTNIYQTTVSTGSNLLVADSFTYDERGNMLTGNGRSYTWDAANRLIGITYSGTMAGASTEFTYDGFGRRVKIVEKDTSGTVTSTKQFVWEGMQIAEERNDSNVVTKQFFGSGQRDVMAGANYYYTRDHLGSVREVVDGSGVLKTRYSYDPYGRVIVTYPASGIPSSASDFGYTGHYTHAKSGLVLAPYRAYDPDLARWLSRDPIAEKGGLNLYGYVKNNPINEMDILGLEECPCKSGLWQGSVMYSVAALFYSHGSFYGTVACTSDPSMTASVAGSADGFGLSAGWITGESTVGFLASNKGGLMGQTAGVLAGNAGIGLSAFNLASVNVNVGAAPGTITGYGANMSWGPGQDFSPTDFLEKPKAKVGFGATIGFIGLRINSVF